MQIGLRSALATEVKSGLQADQTVIIQPDERISDGTRIQASQAGEVEGEERNSTQRR